MNKLKLPKFHWAKILSVFFFILLLGAYANIFAIGSKYAPGTTLDPACVPGEINCSVEISSGGITVDSFNNSVYTETLGSPNVRNSILLGYNVGLGLDLEGTEYYGSNFIGYEAGLGAEGAGDSNFIGTSAGGAASYAPYSNFIGYEAGDHAYYASNSIFIGNNAGSYDGVDNTINNLSSILLGSFTNTGGFSNSILLGSGMSGSTISNTKANQFMLAPSVTEMRLRGVDYTLPASQGGAGTVLTNDGSGGLSWGTVAGGLLSDADFNTKGGTEAGLNYVAGAQNNTFLGYLAGKGGAITNQADRNTAVGSYSFSLNTTGNNNSALGYGSLYLNTTGNNNSALGSSSLQSNTTGVFNSALGSDSLRSNTSGGLNSAFGFESLQSNTTGAANSASGSYSLKNNTAGTSNSAFGYHGLLSNTVGNNNSAFGSDSLSSNKTGSNGVAIGAQSQFYINDTTSAWTNYNTSVGYQSLRGSATAANNTGNYNTAIGYQSLFNNSTGVQNTATGYNSMYSNTSGSNNTSVGRWALGNNISGGYNVAIGFQSIVNNTTGSNNIGLGYQSGMYIGSGTGQNQTSSNSLYLGYDTRASADGNTNEIVVGYGTIGRGSNTAQWGNTSMTNHYFSGNIQLSTYGAGTLITDASGNITASSDERLKDIQGNFNNDNNALDTINSINPILYKWNDESGFDQSTLYAGFSAQNIKDYIPEAVGLDKNGYLTLSDRPILATAINAIQELDLKVKELDEKINGVTLSDMMGEFFGGVIVSVSDGIAYMKGIVVDTLKVGSPEKRTGITLYDELTGDPYCLSISGGVTKTIEGECGIITPVEPMEEEIIEEETVGEEAGTNTEPLNEETLLDDSIIINEFENITTNTENSLEIIEEIDIESEQIISADSTETGSTSEITPITTDGSSIVAN